MDVGSDIGQKMRLAIKVKLREMGCYVDDELPDYVMVMVANKRTRVQMEEDLQLFLSSNTHGFVNWLHQVLRKLQEVTITSISDTEKSKESTFKEKKEKTKLKKAKHKKSDTKKSKKKDKTKKKSQKKSEKKTRPVIPPLCLDMETEPSITDVFAGQILKNHGIIMDKVPDIKVPEEKKNIVDPESISDETSDQKEKEEKEGEEDDGSENEDDPGKEAELEKIEAKIQGLRQKLVQQLDSMSEDEDFLNIRTEAEELMTDFADDVIQEISREPRTPPPLLKNIVKPSKPNLESHTPESFSPPQSQTPSELPQIELILPKRPQRNLETLPSRNVDGQTDASNKRPRSSERFTPDLEPVERSQKASLQSRLGPSTSTKRSKRKSISEETFHRQEPLIKKIPSISESRRPASIVRVTPRPRPTSGFKSNQLLIRAVADAQKSLLTLPSKLTPELTKVKQALVLPIPRVEPQKIVVQVPGGKVASPQRETSDCEIDFDVSDLECEFDREKVDTEYVPEPVTRQVTKIEYIPSRLRTEQNETQKSRKQELVCENNTNSSKENNKTNPQFVVTLDGLDPNVFLAKKLKSEGLLEEGEQLRSKKTKEKIKPVIREYTVNTPVQNNGMTSQVENASVELVKPDIVKKAEEAKTVVKPPEVRKRKASPIIFDIDTKKDAKDRERTTSVSSEGHVATNPASSVANIPQYPDIIEPKVMCRMFPACRYGNACAFQHPPCRYNSSCLRKNCVFSHPQQITTAAVSSHVVPSANFKSITAAGIPNMCKYFPNCANVACHFFHPKPCRYGKSCLNKLECNFYHHELVSNIIHKWTKST